MNRNLYNFFYTLRVRYAEVDAQGIVFNSHYLTYFDCAITEYYRAINYNYKVEVKKNKKDFHVIKTTLEYKSPITFDQILDIGVRVKKIGNTSITFGISIFFHKKKKLLSSGDIIQVYTDQIEKCSTPLSNSFKTKVKKFENKILLD